MSNSFDNHVKEVLVFNKGLTLIITVGNDLRGDDGVGPYISTRLESHKHLEIIDAQDKPENIIDDAINLKPDRIIFIDAADFGGKPGQVKLIPENLIPETTVSTHSIPLSVISKILQNDTGAKTFFIGIQMKTMNFGTAMTEQVRRTADELIRIVSNAKKHVS